MAMKRSIVMLFITSIFLNSCYPEPVQESTEEAVEEALDFSLESYYSTFEEEAALRGVTINLDDHDLISRIEEIEEDGIAGTCQYNSQQSNRITIDLSFWENASHDRREMVVFHELGHCVLLLGHNEDEDNQNACLSIMNSGTSGCTVYYNDDNRDYYLDELFSAL